MHKFLLFISYIYSF